MNQSTVITKEVMTTKHPRWHEFCERLGGSECCAFTGDLTWRCTGDTDKPYAHAVLATMPEIDIDASMAYFEAHGGYCDCEILMNVDRE